MPRHRKEKKKKLKKEKEDEEKEREREREKGGKAVGRDGGRGEKSMLIKIGLL